MPKDVYLFQLKSLGKGHKNYIHANFANESKHMLSSFKWQNGKHRQNTLVTISNCIKISKFRLYLKKLYIYISYFNNHFLSMKSQCSLMGRSKIRHIFCIKVGCSESVTRNLEKELVIKQKYDLILLS